MSKDILILSASPRNNGNSNLLCNQFSKGATESGNLVEIALINEMDIHYCTGCGSCFDRSGQCSQKDDMTVILQKMVDADVIVLATPVYFYTLNAQMKTLIDRTCARYTEINEKDFYFILTAADDDKASMNLTIEEFRGFLSCLKNPKEKGIIYGTGVWKAGEVKNKVSMTDAYQMGQGV